MGLSKNPYLRRIQAKNRVQFLKGAITVVFGLTCVAFFIESLPQSKYQRSCNSEANLRVRRQADGEVSEAEPTTCGEQFYTSHEKGDASKECRYSLNATYGAWQKEDINYDCVSWCDTGDYPTSVFTIRQRKYGFVGFYILGLLYMFLALAIVCDEYFVPALEQVSDKLALSDDVAGATFMAAGGSAPELFTSLIGAFTNSNVGIGTIVGSAVFNILFVLGACAFIVGFVPDKNGDPTVLTLTWFPLSRDCFFYILSLVILMMGFSGDKVEWWEACCMISVYAFYVTFMIFNGKIERWATSKFKKSAPEAADEEEATELTEKPKTKNMWQNVASKAASEATGKKVDFSTRAHLVLHSSYKGDDDMLAAYAIQRLKSFRKAKDPNDIHADAEKPEALTGSPYSIEWPFGENDTLGTNLWKIVSLPLILCMKFTIPDTRFKSVQDVCGGYVFIFSFFMSIVWISAFSWLMVWWATRIGETWNIDPALMGLTILAAGTSVPDLLTSVIVARQGHGDMAVSSSIGSNLFDVTIGLPLPWILYILYSGAPKAVSSEGIFCSIGLLLTMLVVLVSTIIACGWKMNRGMGAAMLGLYVVFVIISLLLEYKVLICPF